MSEMLKLLKRKEMNAALEDLKGRSFTVVEDFTPTEFRALMRRTQEDSEIVRVPNLVLDRAIYNLMFYENSSRTKSAFIASVAHLGGQFNDINVNSSQIARGESIKDTCVTYNHMARGIAIRVADHSLIEEYTKYLNIPLINALSDREHPTQALADMHTIYETYGKLEGLKIAYCGEFNNTARSLLLACLAQGISVSIACPDVNQVDELTKIKAEKLAQEYNCVFEITQSAKQAVKGAHGVYTDTWDSMGKKELSEDEQQARIKVYQEYQVNEALMSLAEPGAIAMHCGPAYRGKEISEETYEKNVTTINRQAENRLNTLIPVLEYTLRR